MARLYTGQYTFTSGELTPSASARIDIPQYKAGVDTLTNFYPKQVGPARRRNGTKYIAEVQDSSKEVRLKRFQTRIDQSYILEFGDTYIRFYTDSGQVTESGQTITGITKANPGVVTVTGHGYSNGDQVYLDNVGGMTEVNGLRFTVANKTANTFELSGVDTSSYTTYTTGGTATKIYEITSPYSESEVQNLQIAQIGDSLYIAHADYEPRVLTRTSSTSWSIDTLNATPAPTIEDGYAPATTLTPGATTGTSVTFTAGASAFLDGDVGRELINLVGVGKATITAVSSATQVTANITEDFPSTSAIASGDWKMGLSPLAELTPDGTAVRSVININAEDTASSANQDTFRSADVGKYIYINGGICEILTVNSANDVDCLVLKALSSDDATVNWTIESKIWNSTNGYPKAIAVHEQRLILAGSSGYPQTIWFSAIGDYDNFGRGTNDSDALSVQMTASQSNTIEWLASSRELVVGTSNTEFSVSGGSSGTITPSNIGQRPRTFIGSQGQQPLLLDQKVYFIQGNTKQILSFAYRYEIDGYEAINTLLLADHFGEDKIREVAFSRQPDNLMLAVTEAGDLLTGAFGQEIGWAKATTDGDFESVATISENNVDQVWVAVEREINGSTKRYIELLEFQSGEDHTDSFFDSYLTYSNPTTITGITKANPGVVTATAHGYSNGDNIKIKNVVGMTEVNDRLFTVANKTANTFELSGVDTSSYTTYDSGGESYSTTTTLDGLEHLEGKTVKVKVDNASHPDRTVSNGQITLQETNTYAEVVVGLSFMSTLKTLNLNSEGQLQGRKMRWVEPILRIYKSGIPTVNSETLPVREPADSMDEAVPLFTGDLRYQNLGWDKTGQLTITSEDAFPLQVNGILGVAEVEDN